MALGKVGAIEGHYWRKLEPSAADRGLDVTVPNPWPGCNLQDGVIMYVRRRPYSITCYFVIFILVMIRSYLIILYSTNVWGRERERSERAIEGLGSLRSTKSTRAGR
jgi:hypothetical protein